jgi:hypothetical protein
MLIPVIFGIEPGEVSIVLRGLKAVMDIDKDFDETIAVNNVEALGGGSLDRYVTHPVHASFSDFIFDPTCSGKFYINYDNNSATIVEAMLHNFSHLLHAPLVTESLSNLFDIPFWSMMTLNYGYQRWLHHFTEAGCHQDALSQKIKLMKLDQWIPLSLLNNQSDVSWDGKECSNLVSTCAAGTGMLLQLSDPTTVVNFNLKSNVRIEKDQNLKVNIKHVTQYSCLFILDASIGTTKLA